MIFSIPTKRFVVVCCLLLFLPWGYQSNSLEIENSNEEQSNSVESKHDLNVSTRPERTDRLRKKPVPYESDEQMFPQEFSQDMLSPSSLRRIMLDDEKNEEETAPAGLLFFSDISDRPKAQILGGQPSNVGDFPYYVDMAGRCGGALVAPNVVVGAAHCGSFIGEEIVVSAYRGGSEVEGGTKVRVTRQARHPDYRFWSSKFDFALYQISESVFPSSSVTLTLNDAFSVPFDGQELTVMGLGVISERIQVTPDILRYVQIQKRSDEYCGSRSIYGRLFHEDNMLCANNPLGGQDSCYGDSGGPLVLRNGNNHVLVGIVSWGFDCGSAIYPGVYSRVSSAAGWMRSVACDSWQVSGGLCS